MIRQRNAFVMIRHGQTDANRDQIIAGRLEAQLTSEGRAAATRLADWPWPGEIALFASPQARARDTAALAFPGRPAVIIAALRERDWGHFEGRPVAELPDRAATPAGGEGWPAMLERVGAAVDQALQAAGDRLPVLVAHSGVIRAVRQLGGSTPHGASPPNSTPLLFAPAASGWQETTLTEKDLPWIA